MIAINQLAYTHFGGKTLRFPDFQVPQGGQCLLLGESGSGKTTLLHVIGGLLKTQQGQVFISHSPMSSLSESALDKFRGQHIGFIFQKNHLIPALTVRENLLMAPWLAGVRQDEGRVETVLKTLNLDEKSNASVLSLSQGQAQRVAIARAVINKPPVILADEPTSALDDRNCDRVIDLLLDVAKENGSTLLIATHDQRLKSKIKQQIIL